VVLAQDSGLGDGRIDNFIVDTSVHLLSGVVVLVTLTLALGLCVRDVLAGTGIDRLTRLGVVVSQISLGVQALLGIKLLDQGQGISQLYIHYIGGLAPLGVFLAAGWLVDTKTERGMKVLTVLLTVGWFSAMMAFFIGRAYVNQ